MARSAKQVAKLTRKLRAIISKLVRLSAADSRGRCRCVTCGKLLHWKREAQAGHFMGARVSPATLFDLRNVNVQCARCNLFAEGMQEFHGDHIERKYGREVRDELKRLAAERKQWTVDELETLIASHQADLAALQKRKAGIL